MKPKEAATMRVIACDCGCRGVTLQLYDRTGRLFAFAEVPRGVGVMIAQQIVDHACPDDPIGEVAGHA